VTIHAASRVVWALTHLGVDEPIAQDLLWAALHEDPTCGAERMLLAIRAWCARQAPAGTDAALLAEARDVIASLSVQIDTLSHALREIHRQEEKRGGVMAIRPRETLPSRATATYTRRS